MILEHDNIQYKSLFEVIFGSDKFDRAAEQISEVFVHDNELLLIITAQTNEEIQESLDNEYIVKDMNLHNEIMSLNNYSGDVVLKTFTRDGTTSEIIEFTDCKIDVSQTYYTYTTDKKYTKYCILVLSDQVNYLN